MKDPKVQEKSVDMVTLMMELDMEVMVHTEVAKEDMEDMEVDFLIKHTIILDMEDMVLDYPIMIKLMMILPMMITMMIMVWMFIWMLIVTMEWATDQADIQI